MKYGYVLCFCLFSFISFSQRVNWSEDYKEALEISKTEDKMILVYFFDGSNKSLEKTIHSKLFKSKVFKTVSNNFIVLKVDKSKDVKLSNNQKIYNKRLLAVYNKDRVFPAVRLINTRGENKSKLQTKFSSEAIADYLTYITTL